MSKKKNTLKDLDEFLKQQAATLVPPSKLSEQTTPPAPENVTSAPPRETEISTEKLIDDLKSLAKKEGGHFRGKFYDLIIRSLEELNQSLPEDKVLINTALYLKNGDRWKEAIREYWRKKAHH